MNNSIKGKLLSACIVEEEGKFVIQPRVFMGTENYDFRRGDILDANKIVELLEKVKKDILDGVDSDALDSLSEIIEALNHDPNYAKDTRRDLDEFKNQINNETLLVIASALNDINQRLVALES